MLVCHHSVTELELSTQPTNNWISIPSSIRLTPPLTRNLQNAHRPFKSFTLQENRPVFFCRSDNHQLEPYTTIRIRTHLCHFHCSSIAVPYDFAEPQGDCRFTFAALCAMTLLKHLGGSDDANIDDSLCDAHAVAVRELVAGHEDIIWLSSYRSI